MVSSGRKARPAEGTVGGEDNERTDDGERRGTSGGLSGQTTETTTERSHTTGPPGPGPT